MNKKEKHIVMYNLLLAVIAIVGFYFTGSGLCFLVLVLMAHAKYPTSNCINADDAITPEDQRAEQSNLINKAGVKTHRLVMQTVRMANMEKEELQKRYDILFEMYAEHIHDHRLGAGKTCNDCRRLTNLEIERRLTPAPCDPAESPAGNQS